MAPTERQLELLRLNDLLEALPPAPTWIHASLVVDSRFGNPAGESARRWLNKGGTPPDEAGMAVAMAMEDVAASRGRSRLRDSRSGVRDRQRREPPSSAEKEVARQADEARSRRRREHHLHQDHHATAHQPRHRGRGVGM